MSYSIQILNKYKKNLIGLFCAFSSYFCYGLSNSFAKKSSEHFHVLQVIFVRQLLILLFAIFMIFVIKKNIQLVKTKVFKTHFLRSCCGFLDLVFCFMAVQYMPLCDVAALAFSYGVFVLFLTPWLMKEQVSKGAKQSVFLGTIGTLIVANPGSGMNVFGCSLSIASGLFTAMSIVLIRLISEVDKAETILFYFAIISATATFIVSYFSDVQFVWSSPFIFDMFVTSFAGMVAQILLTVAITYITPSICSIIAYTTMIWMSFFGYILYGEVPQINFYLGAVLIVIAGFHITIKRLRIENIKKGMQ